MLTRRIARVRRDGPANLRLTPLSVCKHVVQCWADPPPCRLETLNQLMSILQCRGAFSPANSLAGPAGVYWVLGHSPPDKHLAVMLNINLALKHYIALVVVLVNVGR